MNPACATCRHAEPAQLGDALVLECRRYPPTVLLVVDEPCVTFPHVYEGDWCGEWAAVQKLDHT
jgi:hypothetical protein